MSGRPALIFKLDLHFGPITAHLPSFMSVSPNSCNAIVLTRFCWLSRTNKHLSKYSQPLMWSFTLQV